MNTNLNDEIRRLEEIANQKPNRRCAEFDNSREIEVADLALSIINRLQAVVKIQQKALEAAIAEEKRADVMCEDALEKAKHLLGE